MNTRLSRFLCHLAVLAIGVPASVPSAVAQSPLLEIATDNDVELFQVDDIGGMVAKGSSENGDPPATGQGTRLMWWPAMSALRAGQIDGTQWDPDNVGPGSVAFGLNTTASGETAVAMGFESQASGTGAVALGRTTTATAEASVAYGSRSDATGSWSLAGGRQSVASGAAAVALGDNVEAPGTGAIALGTGISALGNHSFAFGDGNDDVEPIVAENSFFARAFGGVRLNTGVGIGCELPAGQGTWACTSSRLAKEGFEDVDGESLLARLAGIRIQRWRYIGSDALHLGPTAEDFREAFGLGVGPTTIGTVDADGVALRGVQALERRTAELRQENDELRRRLDVLEARLREGGR